MLQVWTEAKVETFDSEAECMICGRNEFVDEEGICFDCFESRVEHADPSAQFDERHWSNGKAARRRKR